MRPAVGADRYSYLPSLWIGTPLVAHALHHLVTKLRLPRSAVFGAAVALLAVYGALTRDSAADFATRELLWARAARLDPTDSGAVNQLGLAVQKDGRHAEALPSFRRATELRPSFADAWSNAVRNTKAFFPSCVRRTVGPRI